MIIQRYKRRADPGSGTVQSKVISGDALPGEQPCGPFPPGLAHAGRQLRVPDHPQQRLGQSIRVAGGNEKTRPAVLDGVGLGAAQVVVEVDVADEGATAAHSSR
jgi:hypothetical protein